MNKLIRIGTRGSKLALWQAEHIAGLIKPSGYRTEIVPIETRGDKILDVSISKIGSKGVFTEEIEAGLLNGTIDIAVHSAKDLASEIPDELELVAFTEREQANDVIVSYRKDINLAKDKLKIGTSATRRVAFLKHFYPHVEAATIRGNLQTRFAKLEAGEYDALLLAYAGVYRMGFEHLIVEKIETSYFVPAVGQGSIAIECHKKLSFDKKEILERWVNHPETEHCIRAERAFLRTLQGGCSIPAFGYAHTEGNMITLKGGIISLDGQQIVKAKHSAPPADFKALGERVGDEVLINGGSTILSDIKSYASTT
ncbi:hydroxymethylbilane synthase [Chryseolinea lacunae]|uniref:Porphobilinogen deaminase n=1 Tax=Chryseolinea lacunae TaxID=2801331 RepID=A0ABS1KLW5_9BACT|nr:hydroxymethylbilane synthase [Chryseolinea lacunae]MBL0740218.1 hydroxymethylbilane synthase [Chryseolinea lacunae]